MLLKDILNKNFNGISTVDDFLKARIILKKYGINKFLNDFKHFDYVDKNNQLTTNDNPYNFFARLVVGKEPIEDRIKDENIIIKNSEFSNKFIIGCNLLENDIHWNDPNWNGRASMSKYHRFLVLKDLSFWWFNILVFGINDKSQLQKAIELVKYMQKAAQFFAKQNNWSNNLGLYFHVYGFNSVHSLHLHMIDLDFVGPTFHYTSYKNLSLENVLIALTKELYDYTIS